MSVLDRVAARMPWARLAEAVADERRAIERLSKRVESLRDVAREHAERMGTLDERLRDRDSRFLALARRQQVRLAPPEFHALVRAVHEDQRTLLGSDRLYVLWQAARNTAPLALPALEIGSFRGGSARFLAEALRGFAGSEPELHVVDTFEGHVAEDISAFEPAHEAGRFGEASFDDVRAYLSAYSGVQVHRGRFPEGAEEYLPDRLGLVHLDVDLYTPTAASLALLADRVTPGGVVVVDDFGALKTPGILKAVEEFLAGDPPFQSWDVDTEQVVLVRR
jgi:hypothetical protein